MSSEYHRRPRYQLRRDKWILGRTDKIQISLVGILMIKNRIGYMWDEYLRSHKIKF